MSTAPDGKEKSHKQYLLALSNRSWINTATDQQTMSLKRLYWCPKGNRKNDSDISCKRNIMDMKHTI